METITQFSEIMANREQNYRFLAEIYKTEITSKMLEGLENMHYDMPGRGYTLIKNYLDNRPADVLTDLAVDYARVFLGAGIVEKDLISAPYESVYTNPERLIMQNARDEVLAIYRKNGVDRAKGFDVPEDHIAIEFEFMAYLCAETVNADNENNSERTRQLLQEQTDFIDGHLQRWVPQFCDEVFRFSRTDFYRGIALITEEYIQMDREILSEIDS